MKKLKQRFAGRIPRLIMFDLDGTLVDSVPDLAAAVDVMLTQLGRPTAGVEVVRHWVGNGAMVLVQRALANSYDYSSVSEDEAAPALDLFLQAYAQEQSRTCLYSTVLDTLHTLRDSGVLLAMITNKPERFLPDLLKQHQLDGLFSWVIGGDTLPYKKPEPGSLLWVMQQAQVEPQECLFVGDSRNDILAAKAAQVCCAALTYGYNHGQPIELENPDWIIDSLSQLLD